MWIGVVNPSPWSLFPHPQAHPAGVHSVLLLPHPLLHAHFGLLLQPGIRNSGRFRKTSPALLLRRCPILRLLFSSSSPIVPVPSSTSFASYTSFRSRPAATLDERQARRVLSVSRLRGVGSSLRHLLLAGGRAVFGSFRAVLAGVILQKNT